MASETAVRSWREKLVLPTYLPARPDLNPMFLEKRVYQGSSGRVYPLPFTDRIAETPVDRDWQAVWIENEFLKVLVLPELGGRIHRLLDKTNGYDVIYHQPVIKPALVGLAGPWASGGIEFNWPQHHRPATFLPVEVQIERHADGSQTIWCSDHDPMSRMKGMHGVCLHPGRAYLELKVRAYNRTPFVQTFLWWANVATRVHEGYRSFFPPDARYVADHARRSMTSYPLAHGHYYGVDYGERGRSGVPADEMPQQFVPPHCSPDGTTPRPRPGRTDDEQVSCTAPDYAANDLSYYANIPVPTSYMCMGSREDFFGGYDYKARAGIVHLASHHISPGKKQWTWGNHEFGYAWDRNLTDADAKGEHGPYIEIMAGVYTDNQPDFSFLQSGETKRWSQYWYPIREIGPARHANLAAAVSLELGPKRFRLAVAVTSRQPGARILLERDNASAEWDADLAPEKPFVLDSPQAAKPWKVGETTLRVLAADGRPLISYQPRPSPTSEVPPPASEPPPPTDIASADELFITGLHLEQYRHATRCPTLYWREALRRDPFDSRCHNAMGRWHMQRGEFAIAEAHFHQALCSLTRLNANPADGEPSYNLGLCLRHQNRDDAAYDALYKATWNQAWAGAAHHALAEIDCCRGHWLNALDHLERSLCHGGDNLRARNLEVMVLRQAGRPRQAAAKLRQTLRLDPLDAWARHLAVKPLRCDIQTRLDLAHDLARGGFFTEAIQVLEAAASQPGDLPDQSWGAAPLIGYTLGWLHEKLGASTAARKHYAHAAGLAPDYCFPARLEEIAILTAAMAADPKDSRAPYYLGNLLYDRRRHEEAIRLWERSARLDSGFSVVWRNLGIGYFNIRRQPSKARAAYNHALRAQPTDARLLYERDQLWKRLGVSPIQRLRELEKRPELVRQRDDLSVEVCALFNQVGRHAAALEVVGSRHFQPWEGGEGGPLAQHVRAHLALGRRAMPRCPTTARAHFAAALTTPRNLGEARHLLANQSDIRYWLGCACKSLGDHAGAREHWHVAATFRGDFQAMSVRAFSELTYYSARACEQLGRRSEARRLLTGLLAYAHQLQQARARVDYFATSLPTMLLFDDDLQFRQETTALFLQAQALLGLGRRRKARTLLAQVLRRDPNHPLAADLIVDRQIIGSRSA